MIGLDTNVLVRYFADDDPVQSRQATHFIETHCTRDSPGFVDRVALCELVWVLKAYGYRRTDIVRILEQLLATSDVLLEDQESVRSALRLYESTTIDFADALIGQVNRARGCVATATFDRKAAKLSGFIRVA